MFVANEAFFMETMGVVEFSSAVSESMMVLSVDISNT